MKANLFIAGACKSGTSFLHDFLGRHPDICASNPKEPYFFELEERYRDEEKYIGKYFSHRNSEKYLLDGRHRNMFFNWIPKSIYDYNDQSKIILILRNPVDRAFSHWWMWYSRGLIKTNFRKTIRKELSKIESVKMTEWDSLRYNQYIRNSVPNQRIAHADFETILESGLYYKQILRLKSIFDASQILILDFDILKDKEKLNLKLSKFLNLEFNVQNLNTLKVNQAKELKKIKKSFWFFSLVPKPVKIFFKKIFLNKPKLKEKDRLSLNNFYRNQNLKLKDEFKLDFVEKWY